MTARDKLWLFGVRAHQDDIWLGRNRGQGPLTSYRSRITPAEGALMLDIPNMAMIVCDGEPATFSDEAYGYAESFCRMKQVLWGASGSNGYRCGNEEQFIVELSRRYPNITGAYLDDIIGDRPEDEVLALLAKARQELDRADRHLDMMATWYFRKKASPQVLAALDGVTLCSWRQEELDRLEENFERIEAQCTHQKKILLCYLFDFPSGLPVTEERMAHQCEYGLQLLRQGRIDGMMFEANSVMGVGLPSELWLRRWLEQVKDTPVPD